MTNEATPQKSNSSYTLITGASFGIGFEMAKILAQKKYALILVARSQQKLEEIKGQLQHDYGVEVQVITADLSRPESPQKIMETCQNSGWQVDMLINNAGYGLLGDFLNLSLEQQSEMIQLNVNSLVTLSHLLMKSMRERRQGKVLNVASTAAFQPGPLMAVYYATKAFVLSFSEALYQENKKYGVSVSCLCPGPTTSEFQKRAGMGDVLLFNSKTIAVMSAQQVAEVGIEGFLANQRLIIPGAINNVAVFMLRFSPRALVLEIVNRLQSSL